MCKYCKFYVQGEVLILELIDILCFMNSSYPNQRCVEIGANKKQLLAVVYWIAGSWPCTAGPGGGAGQANKTTQHVMDHKDHKIVEQPRLQRGCLKSNALALLM